MKTERSEKAPITRMKEMVRNSRFNCSKFFRILSIFEPQTDKNATKHAEFSAIEQAKEFCSSIGTAPAHVFRRSTLYVTLEPCIMCASALRICKFGRVVYGACNDRFGDGFSLLIY